MTELNDRFCALGGGLNGKCVEGPVQRVVRQMEEEKVVVPESSFAQFETVFVC